MKKSQNISKNLIFSLNISTKNSLLKDTTENEQVSVYKRHYYINNHYYNLPCLTYSKVLSKYNQSKSEN